MNDSMTDASLARFANCQTKEEAETLLKELCQPFNAVTSQFKKARTRRVVELRKAELAPFHELASRFRPGQKVYFATGIKSCALDWSFNHIPGSDKDIKAGDWCRVYQYQPKVRRLWLCRPGLPCTRANVIRDSFSLRAMMDLGISRTELSVRAK